MKASLPLRTLIISVILSLSAANGFADQRKKDKNKPKDKTEQNTGSDTSNSDGRSSHNEDSAAGDQATRFDSPELSQDKGGPLEFTRLPVDGNLGGTPSPSGRQPIAAPGSQSGAKSLSDLLKEKRDAKTHPVKGLGTLRPPAKTLLKNEGKLIGPTEGLQSNKNGRFQGVRQGTPGDPKTTYLFTIDDRGINVAHEKTPFPTPRGNIVHTNLSEKAYSGGEVWFNGNKVTINAGSGRFGHGTGLTEQGWNATIKYWQHLGYEVEARPLGSK